MHACEGTQLLWEEEMYKRHAIGNKKGMLHKSRFKEVKTEISETKTVY